MKIQEIGPLAMARTDAAHAGKAKFSEVAGAPLNDIPSAADAGDEKKRASFEEFLLGAVESMNSHQVEVAELEKKAIADPESVDPQDVTIAMAKARMSLNLAQTVIDRVITDWNEITTTR